MCITDFVCICRLDNLIYGGEAREVVAVLDWELSTLGDPVSDLAYVCMPYHMEPDQPQLKGTLRDEWKTFVHGKQILV